MCENDIEKKAKWLAHQYHSDVNDEDLAEEIQYLQVVHKANFRKPELKTLELLKLWTEYKLCELFPNVCISLWILLTIPATVASAQRSFSDLKPTKNYLGSTMSQVQLESKWRKWMTQMIPQNTTGWPSKAKNLV